MRNKDSYFEIHYKSRLEEDNHKFNFKGKTFLFFRIKCYFCIRESQFIRHIRGVAQSG